MKKFLSAVCVIIFSVNFVGCEDVDLNRSDSLQKDVFVDGSESLKELESSAMIEYSVIPWSKAPESINNIVSMHKGKKGYLIYNKDNLQYLIILSGKKNSGGYSISVKSVNKTEDNIIINIEEKAPSGGDVVIQAITYPYIILQINLQDHKFKIIDGEYNEYTKIEEVTK
ncbi:protease complex subunit PrcB family protein [Clostridium sp. MSJ-4]|uniref:Protease complex subunit PrcB family protein n=1 Tax=Clostridium simiarum TaxID=2841506 RepID=A0ABS6EWB4_9CLOT|nr:MULTISPECIES: protease complex subunit PrcB family protein [Clostridium]MBU5590518.1 protease complex subunit PrcB family protein [Clostridium simiarum]